MLHEALLIAKLTQLGQLMRRREGVQEGDDRQRQLVLGLLHDDDLLITAARRFLLGGRAVVA